MNQKSVNALSDITVFNKYAKFIPELGRRETWSEIVTRNMHMHQARFPDLASEIGRVYERYVITKKVLPSMRSLQFGGRPIELSHSRIFNCLSRDTAFVTDQGIRTFQDFNDGEAVRVLTDKGRWKNAVVRSYGEQQLQTITLGRGRHQTTVEATANHRWLLADGGVTTQLRVGDKLKALAPVFEEFNYDTAELEEQLYWCYGFIYGDGTLVNKGKPSQASMVRLCGAKVKHLEKFTNVGFPHSFPPSCNQDPMVYTGKYAKTLPNRGTHPALIRAFVAGYLDADGSKSTQLSLQTSSVEAQNFIREMFPVAGVFVTSERVINKTTNYGPQDAIIFGLTKRFAETPAHLFIVRDIQPKRRETVWCLEVEDDASFVLASGAVTGNCAYMPAESPKFFSELMFLLLGGTGVGYSVQKRHVGQLPSVKAPKSDGVHRFQIQDSIIGWADTVKVVAKAFFHGGTLPAFDYRDIRDKGTELVTTGGKAPGPEPLKLCVKRLIGLFRQAVGRKLTPLEVHDMACAIADSVRAGGIRRAAMICLFDRKDQDMLRCKAVVPTKVTHIAGVKAEDNGMAEMTFIDVYGQLSKAMVSKYDRNTWADTGCLPWYLVAPARGRANNSAVLLRNMISEEEFTQIMGMVEASGCGEPGVYWTNNPDWGTNPCCRLAA